MALLKKDGNTIAAMPYTAIASWLQKRGKTLEDYELILDAEESRDLVRQHIREHAGDTLSLLGTTADATQLLLFEFFTLITRLQNCREVNDVCTAVQPMVSLAEAFLANIASGAVLLPYQIKGVEVVMPEIEQRATAVTKALLRASSGDEYV